MKSFWLVPVWALPLHALAAEQEPKAPVRTTLLGTCSKQAHAKGLKGDERKKFISACIASGKQAKAAARPPAS